MWTRFTVVAWALCASGACQQLSPRAEAAEASADAMDSSASSMSPRPSAHPPIVSVGTHAGVQVTGGVGDGPQAPPDTSPRRSDLPTTCERPGQDKVKALFCAETAPQIGSLQDLKAALGLRLPARLSVGPGPFPDDGEAWRAITSIVFLGHSTALSGRLVSPINPRLILRVGPVVMAFQRGVQRVELVAFEEETNELNFYLVRFRQACNETPAGCRPFDLYTPALEHDWRAVSLQDDEDLKNTASDCRQCHQRGLDMPMLLMRELRNPWTHFFGFDTEEETVAQPMPGVTDRDLVRDFIAAHGDEPYAGVSDVGVKSTIGFMLEAIVQVPQPVLFDAPAIFAERWGLGPNGYAAEPVRSTTWDQHYEAFKRGEQLALPHYENRPTAAEKQAMLADAYARCRTGELPPDALPDLADIFPDDPQLRAEIGLDVELDATPAEALIQACGACHNDVLDQTISRARFNVDLSRMDPAEIEQAVLRLRRAPEEPGVMPPPEARQLPEAVRSRVIAYLERGERSAADEAALSHAALLGMAGGAQSLSPAAARPAFPDYGDAGVALDPHR